MVANDWSIVVVDKSSVFVVVDTCFILMDEPTSALDPISTSKIEELALELKKDYTIVVLKYKKVYN